MTKPERIRLLTLGLAAGDALGSTSEFSQRDSIPSLFESVTNQGWPFRQIGGGAFDWKPGGATDDTDMAMCIVRSRMRLGRFDGADVAQEFVEWLNSSPPDIGSATRRGLSAVRSGTVWYEGGLNDYRQNPKTAANGSLMRNGVVAGLADSLQQAFSFSVCQSLPTHYAPLPVLCCCAQTYLIWELLEGRNPLDGDWLAAFRLSFMAWLNGVGDEILKAWRFNVADHIDAAWGTLTDANFDPDSFNPFTSNISGMDGYCLLTLQIADPNSSRRGRANLYLMEQRAAGEDQGGAGTRDCPPL